MNALAFGMLNVTDPGPARKQITLACPGCSQRQRFGDHFLHRGLWPPAANPGLPSRSIMTGPVSPRSSSVPSSQARSTPCTVRATNAFGNGPNVTTTPLVVTAKAQGADDLVAAADPEALGDHFVHDLVGAAADALEARVAERRGRPGTSSR